MCCKEGQAEGQAEGSRLANACLVVDALGPRGEDLFGGGGGGDVQAPRGVVRASMHGIVVGALEAKWC